MTGGYGGYDAPFRFSYEITFKDGSKRVFTVKLDPDTLSLIPEKSPEPKEWARLGFHGCPDCPLDPAEHEYCPCAVNLMELMDFLGGMVSHERVSVVVETPNRSYLHDTSLQQVGSSLIGIIMVTSGCPILDKLRPMAETHLPFASLEESTYRYITMYLFAQYFRHKKGMEADWEMKGLVELFSAIERVNIAFCRRLDMIRTEDASVNAVTILNSMSTMAQLAISADDMAHWEDIIMRRFG